MLKEFSLVVPAAARAGGGTAPLGRARARDAGDFHHYPAWPGGSAALSGAAPRHGVSLRQPPGSTCGWGPAGHVCALATLRGSSLAPWPSGPGWCTGVECALGFGFDALRRVSA